MGELAFMTVLAPFLAFLAVILFAIGVLDGTGADTRMLGRRMSVYGGNSSALVGSGSASILKTISVSNIPVLNRLLGGSAYLQSLAIELQRAGVPLRAGEYILFRWLGAVAMFFIATFVGLPMLVAIAPALLVFFAPRFVVSYLQMRRLKKFQEQLVDGLDMMSNGLKGGASFLQAIDLVAKEMPAPLGQEFGQAVAEVGVGAELEEALQNLLNRVRSYDLYLLVTAILVQRNVVGNLSEIIDNIAYTIRERIRILNDLRAQTAEMRFSAMVVGLLPFVLFVGISFLSPGYLFDLTGTATGRTMLVIALLLEIAGFFVMRKITDIEV